MISPAAKLLSSLINSKDDNYVEDVFAKISAEQMDMVSPGSGLVFNAIIKANDATDGKDRSVQMIENVAKRTPHGEGTLLEAMRAAGVSHDVLEQIGNEATSEHSGREYLESVLREAMGQTLSRAAVQLIEIARDMSIPTGGLIREADKLVTSAVTSGGSHIKHIKTVSNQIVRVATGGAPPKNKRVKSGFGPFDEFFGGHTAGKAIVVPAPPQNAKTTLVQNLFTQPAARGEMAIAYFAREDDAWSITSALLSQHTGPETPWVTSGSYPKNGGHIHVNRVREIGEGDGDDPTENELAVLINADKIVSGMALYVDDVSRSPEEMRATIRRIVRMHSDKFVLCILDYIQLAGPEGKGEVERIEQMADFVRSSMSRELLNRGSWIVTSQLDKNTTKDIPNKVQSGMDVYPDEVYHMSGMKGSSAIEQMADGVMGPFMPDSYRHGPSSLANSNSVFEEVNLTIFKNKIKRKRGRAKAFLDTRSGKIYSERPQ